MRAHHDANDPMLHTGMLKGFMDGSLGSRTAAMKAPFADDPGNSGLPQYTQAELNRMSGERAQAGFQLGFHAIGDKAAAMALDAFSQAAHQRLSPQSHRARAGRRSRRTFHALQGARRDRVDAAQSSADRHELGRRAAGAAARRIFLCVESVSRCRRAAGIWTDYPVEPITPFRGLMQRSRARTRPAQKSTTRQTN